MSPMKTKTPDGRHVGADMFSGEAAAGMTAEAPREPSLWDDGGYFTGRDLTILVISERSHYAPLYLLSYAPPAANSPRQHSISLGCPMKFKDLYHMHWSAWRNNSTSINKPVSSMAIN